MSVAHWRHRAGNDPFAAPGLSRETLQPPPQPPNEQQRFLASITAHQLDLQRRHRVREQPVCPPTRHHPPGALQALQLIRRKALDATETVPSRRIVTIPPRARLRAWTNRFARAVFALNDLATSGLCVTQSAPSFEP
jgi:hypothetical protein